jgi:two-component system, CitB family, sensor kinase
MTDVVFFLVTTLSRPDWSAVSHNGHVPSRLRVPLATQLVVVQLVLIAAVLVAVSAVSVEQTRISFQRDQGQRVLALAEVLAASATVRDTVGTDNDTLLPAATTQLQATTGIGLVMVVGVDGVVLASSNPLLVDEQIAWPELAAAPERSSTATTQLGGQSYLVAAAPILSNPETTGEPVRQLGIAVVGEENPSRLDALATAAPTLITYLGAAMVLGIVGSLLVARWIKRQTLGLEPAEIAAVVEQREAIFTGIAEGVIALDPSDRVTMVNPLAARLLSLPPDTAGQSLDELKIEGRLRDVLTGTNGDEPDAVVIRSGRVLVLNRSPVVHDGRTIGSVTTLRDRTQLADLESEIGAFRGTTDLLRAQTHEFANQLHTISGLIQIGDYDEVVGYVDALTEGRAALDLTVARRVRDRPVAALLIAKSAVAAERQVSLRVSQQTHLDALEPGCSFDVATVLGNLVQNGIDAAASVSGREGGSWVQVEIHQSGRAVELIVSDNGPGVDATIATEVFEHGFTTKAAQDGERGIGLALTRLICRRRGGEVEINNTADGARFVARMTISPAEAVVRA